MNATKKLSLLVTLSLLALGFTPLCAFAQSGVQYVYDDLGRLVGVIDPSGNAAGYQYDAVGNLLAITRYTAGQIGILNFSPASGPVGTTVTIRGTGFSTTISQDAVSFNGTSASVTSATANQLVVTVPSGATTGPLAVTAPAGTFTTLGSFTVTTSNGQPTITSFSPTIAAAGTAITVTGTNFDPVPSNDRLGLNVTQQFVGTATSTTLSTTVPAATTSGRLTLATPGGTTQSSQDLFIPFGSHVANDVGFTGRTSLGGTQTITISAASKIGLLLFDAQAGQRLTLRMSGSTLSSCTLYVFSPTSTQLSSTGCTSATTLLGGVLLPITGTYTLGLDPSTTTGSLTLSLNVPPDVAGSIVPNGSAVTVTTTTPGQDGWLTFNGTAGQQVSLLVNGVTNPQAWVNLVKPDGTVQTYIGISPSGSSAMSSQTLATAGVYTLWIQHISANFGSETIQLYSQNPGSIAPPSRPFGAALDTRSPLFTNLAGLFLMNEGSGPYDENLVDGQVANLSGTSLPTWNTSDPSIVFNGGASLNSYLNAGTDLIFDRLTPGQMTIVAKVYVSTMAAAGIAEKNDGNTIDSGFAFGWDSTGALSLTVEKSGANMNVVTAGNLIPVGQWVQVAATWDGTIGTAAAAHLFINGVEDLKASSANGSGTTGYANATQKPFRIGSASLGTAGSLNGKIAYLAVYKGRILTTTEITQLDSNLPTNSSDVVSAITPNGSPVTVTTTTAGQKARLLFYGNASQLATVQLSNNTMGSVTVSLMKPDNTTVLNSVTSAAATFSLPLTWLPSSGVHTISIQPGSTSTGSITATLTLANAPSRPSGATLDTTNALSTNLAGLFLMNEASGTTDLNLADAQVANFSGTSLPTWNTTDPSIVFNGGTTLNSYLNAGTDLAFDQLPTSKVTVVAKVYVNTMAAGGVAEKNDGNSIDSGFVFGWDSTGALGLIVEASAADMRAYSAGAVITAGQWMQVAFTWDGTGGAARASGAHLYLNAVEQSKVTATDGNGTLGYANATNRPFRIGNAAFDTIGGSLNGKMAYLAVYKGRILTTTEMAQLDTQLPIH